MGSGLFQNRKPLSREARIEEIERALLEYISRHRKNWLFGGGHHKKHYRGSSMDRARKILEDGMMDDSVFVKVLRHAHAQELTLALDRIKELEKAIKVHKETYLGMFTAEPWAFESELWAALEDKT